MKSEWVVVKGVSQFADTSTHESWKTFACVMAASLVSNILCDSCVFEQWPHFEGIYIQASSEGFLTCCLADDTRDSY